MRPLSVHTPLLEPPAAIVTTFGPLGRGAVPPLGVNDLVGEVAQALIDGECDEAAHGEVAATCMDDRLRASGSDPLLPNIAGGCFGLLLAARAVLPAYDPEILTARGFMGILRESGLPVYAHIDQQFHEGVQTGCAFNDRLPQIGATLPEIVEETLALFGADAWSRRRAGDLAGRIRAVTAVSPGTGKDPYGEDGFSRLEAVREVHGTTEVLSGTHHPLGADISFHTGRTLSRALLDADRAVKLFHLDAWSFTPTASALAEALPRSTAQASAHIGDDDLVFQMATAMLLAGFSALSVLCSPETLLVIRP